MPTVFQKLERDIEIKTWIIRNSNIEKLEYKNAIKKNDGSKTNEKILTVINQFLQQACISKDLIYFKVKIYIVAQYCNCQHYMGNTNSIAEV